VMEEKNHSCISNFVQNPNSISRKIKLMETEVLGGKPSSYFYKKKIA